MEDDNIRTDEPCYVISVVSKLVSIHPQTLRYYDKISLLRPSRTSGRTRLYSMQDLEKLRKIRRLTVDLGVNLAGVEVILNMTKRIEELQRQLERAQRNHEKQVGLLREQIRELGAAYQQKEAQRIIEVTDLDQD